MGLKVEAIVDGPFAETTYLAWDESSREALVVDPGCRLRTLEQVVEREKLTPALIINTHGHIDHVAGAAQAQERFRIPLWLHSADAGWLEQLALQARLFGLPVPQAPKVDRWLADGETFQVGEQQGRVLHTPGHSAGGICLFFPEAKVLFSGDTLFRGSIGRTDLPGGSLPQLLGSIRGSLFPLGDAVTFYPGHGPSGTLGNERAFNPFAAVDASSPDED